MVSTDLGGGMDQADAEKIHRKGVAYAEANVYSMNNQYLSKEQKADVEGIFQLPYGSALYTFFGYLLFVDPQGYLLAAIYAVMVNIFVGMIVWVGPNQAFAKMGVLFGGTVCMLVSFGFAIYFGVQGNWIGMAVGVAGGLGLISIIEPCTYIMGLGSRPLHPKYVIAKKLFGIEFPFESDL